MARMRLLDLVRPFSSLMPEVTFPYYKVDQQDRILYTAAAAFVYVLLAEVTIFGTTGGMQAADPIGWLRPALAMSHGTLADLGVMPIVLSGFIFQTLAGMRKISASLDIRSDRSLFQSLQKLVALLIAAGYSVVLAYTGDYLGGVKINPIFVALQLFLGSAFVILLDELLSKGYGYVPGTILFTMISASQWFAWLLLGVESTDIPGSDLTSIHGIIPSFFASLNSRSFTYTLTQIAFRTESPNLITLMVSVAVFGAVLYLSLIRLNLQVRSTKMRAQSSSFPIRLFYTGVVPVLFATSALAAGLLTSYALSSFLGSNNVVVKVLGQWDLENARPFCGLAALFVPLHSYNPITTLLRVAAYTILFAGTGAWAASVWTQSSGFAPQDIAKQFKENSIVLVGKRDVSVVKELRRVIPLAATIGGAIIGLSVGLVDSLGPAGSGSVMTVAALNVFSIFEQLASEGMMGQEALQALM